MSFVDTAVANADTSVTILEWQRLASPAGQRVALRNGCARSVALRLELAGVTGPGGVPADAFASAVLAERFVVGANRASSVVLRLPRPQAVPAGRYAGDLVVRAADSPDTPRPLTTRGFEVDVPLPPLATPTWKARVIRWLPFPKTQDTARISLPAALDPGGRLSAATCDRAVLLVDSGATDGIRACVDTAVHARARPVLQVSGVRHAGLYTGVLIPPPRTAADSLVLTVRVTDFVLWPVLALTLGVVVATLSQHYFGVRRAYWDLQRRVHLLTPAWADARAYVAAEVPNGPSIDADFAKQVGRLHERLTATPRPLFTAWDANDPGYVAVTKRLGELEEVVQQWSVFAGQLRTMRGAAAAVTTAAAKVTAPRPVQPAGSPHAMPPAGVRAAHAVGSAGEMTLDEFAARRTQVGELVPFLRNLSGLFTRAAHDQTWLAELRQLGATPPAGAAPCTWDGVEAQLRSAVLDLWEAANDAELVARNTATSLVALEHCLAGAVVPSGQTPGVAPHAVPTEALRGAGAATAAAAAAARRLSPRDAANRAETLGRRIRRFDVRFAAVTWLVAVLLWLPESYLGKPFGSLRDYLAALTWGFGTNVGVALLLTALGKLKTLGGVTAARLGGARGASVRA